MMSQRAQGSLFVLLFALICGSS